MLKSMSNEGDENEEVVIQKEKNPNEKKEKKRNINQKKRSLRINKVQRKETVEEDHKNCVMRNLSRLGCLRWICI